MDELIREFLIESQEGLDSMERYLTDLEMRPQDAELLAAIFRSVHTIKGTTSFLGYTRLEKLAHYGENLLDLLREGKLIASKSIIAALLQLLDTLRFILNRIESDGTDGDAAEDSALIAQLEKLQVTAQIPVLEPVLLGALAEVVPQKMLQSNVPTQPIPPHAESGSDSARQHGENNAAKSSLRVDVALLNQMMNLIGELVLTRNQLLQATTSDPSLISLSQQLDMVTADLREAVMKARIQPISNVFGKMPCLVRNLSQILGRSVRLLMEGQEIELDKSLLEAIKDPLAHAVRNVLDHGIEPPNIREANGKDPEGTLWLRAIQHEEHVIVEVADDGAGISVEKVRTKAVERGLISAKQASHMPEHELLRLIFLPGFSTAAKVTNISGRGVGMDVVRANIEKIGGKVEIESRVGEGTKLRLHLPLTSR